MFNDLLKTKKMRDVCTINLAAVSRRDLCYVSENESFCFGKKMDFQVPGQAWGSGVGVRCSLLMDSAEAWLVWRGL